MIAGPAARRLLLTLHVATSVGWLGATAVFLALAVAALSVDDPGRVRAAYVAMDLTAWTALVPLALGSLATGVLQSLVTKWGLFRHYWVVVKLVLTLVATVVLVAYTQTIEMLAASGARSASPLLHSAAALLLLVFATVLGIYKPAGLTPYGWRRR